eukprot:1498655-Pleurochrysis_carterae.AAC.1
MLHAGERAARRRAAHPRMRHIQTWLAACKRVRRASARSTQACGTCRRATCRRASRNMRVCGTHECNVQHACVTAKPMG